MENLLRIQDFSSIGSLLEAVIQHRTVDPRANTLLELSRTRSVQGIETNEEKNILNLFCADHSFRVCQLFE